MEITITMISFSYIKGYPTDPNGNGGGFVFDCRYLPNPGHEKELKTKTGLDPEVQTYLKDMPEVENLCKNIKAILEVAIQSYQQRGYTNLMVCFGCTGGQHRSVFVAEVIYKWLKATHSELNLVLEHREQNKKKIFKAHETGFMIMCFFVYEQII